jgi:hypothetical protein
MILSGLAPLLYDVYLTNSMACSEDVFNDFLCYAFTYDVVISLSVLVHELYLIFV